MRFCARAPVSGRVLNLLVHTVGGVIKPGDTLANIVPDKDPLVVEAFVSPREIDRVRDGMPARIRFTAFNSKTPPELNGTVVDISADHTMMAENAPPGFKVRVKLTDGETERLGEHAMLPGMEAELLFTSAERTVISYLAKPLTDQIGRASANANPARYKEAHCGGGSGRLITVRYQVQSWRPPPRFQPRALEIAAWRAFSLLAAAALSAITWCHG
ncbi:MAG: HlyD family efflux transporter periplasmic adaptor subunit [Hyphomicrobiaceae bacterium]|nr:HlyD family efflux transporter periplasmic adaptor subunit [Hyphomicrobiaceae bacterium]